MFNETSCVLYQVVAKLGIVEEKLYSPWLEREECNVLASQLSTVFKKNCGDDFSIRIQSSEDIEE